MSITDKNIRPGLYITVVIIFSLLLLLTDNTNAQVINLKLSKRTIEAGDSSLLKWEVKRASKKDTIIISGIGVVKKSRGSVFVKPEKSTKYLLTVNNKKVRRKRAVKLTVKTPSIISFSGPEIVNIKSRCVLKWKTENVNKVEILEEGGYLHFWDSLVVTPTKPTTYIMKACNRYNFCVTDSVHVDIEGDYAGGPKTLRAGESGYLEWRFENADSVSIENISKDLPSSGTLKISPVKTSTYRFIVNKKGKDGTDTVINEVIKVAVVKSNYIKGTKSYISLPSGKRLIFDIFATDWTNFPDSIILRVMVTDTSGNYITGLAPPYCSENEARKFFKTIIENIEEQRVPINNFKVKEIRTMQSPPNDISMVLDYSGSMSRYFNKLDKTTNLFIKYKHEEDRIGVVRFDDKIEIESPLKKLSSELLDTIPFNNGRGLGGSTALYAASDAGLRLLNDSSRKKHLIVMTDGFENSSMAYWGTYSTFSTEVIKSAIKDRVTITTIDFAGQANTPLMEAMAGMTGGNYYQLAKADDIEKVFIEIKHLFHNYYEIVYKPADIPGERTIELVYNDNAGNFETASTIAYVSPDSNNIAKIADIEREGILSDSLIAFVNNKPVLTTQTIALFDFNKFELTLESKKKLDVMVSYLKQNPGQKIMVVGHSDLKGADNYCFELSYKRASEVYNYLLKKGISAKQMSLLGSGKTSPVWKTEDVEWKAKENRRVEILFLQ